MAQKPIVGLTQFNRAEFAHALYYQVFRSRISVAEANRLWLTFDRDCAHGIWNIVDLPGTIWDAGIRLARQYGPTLGVGTLDSLHVACAIELKADKFWTFDERQQKLAEAVGLDVTP